MHAVCLLTTAFQALVIRAESALGTPLSAGLAVFVTVLPGAIAFYYEWMTDHGRAETEEPMLAPSVLLVLLGVPRMIGPLLITIAATAVDLRLVAFGSLGGIVLSMALFWPRRGWTDKVIARAEAEIEAAS